MRSPLVTDLDGTLIRTDSLWEGVLSMLGEKPYLLVFFPLWLLRGKLYFKKKILPYSLKASRFFPFNESVLETLQKAKAEGREIYMATASFKLVADTIADRLGLFTGVFASDAKLNLKGKAKAELLTRTFGDKGFDYMGDSAVDFPVWRACSQAVVVSNNKVLAAKTAALNPNTVVIETRPVTVGDYLRAIRIHQWMKNLLVFVPLLLSHMFTAQAFCLSAVAFLSFSLCASSVYILNDLLDLFSDRQHHDKKFRPFAAGDIPVTHGPFIIFILLLCVALTCIYLRLSFVLILLLYYTLTISYSLYFKKKLLLDTICLSCLYFIRVAAGATAIGSGLSNWIIAFCFFLFLSLGLMKRVTELIKLKDTSKLQLNGRAYVTEDRSMLETMSVCAAFGCMVILALYIDSLQASLLYSNPEWLWGALPLATYWCGRILLLTHRGQMMSDPVAFVLKDKASWCCTAMGALLIFCAM